MKLAFHFTCQLGPKLSLGGTGRHKKREGSIDAGLVGLADGREGSGIVLELVDLRWCVYALWAGAKRTKRPCALADEAREVTNYWLDCLEDLLTG